MPTVVIKKMPTAQDRGGAKKVEVKQSIIEDGFGNKYKQVIKDGEIKLKLVEDSKGIMHE